MSWHPIWCWIPDKHSLAQTGTTISSIKVNQSPIPFSLHEKQSLDSCGTHTIVTQCSTFAVMVRLGWNKASSCTHTANQVGFSTFLCWICTIVIWWSQFSPSSNSWKLKCCTSQATAWACANTSMLASTSHSSPKSKNCGKTGWWLLAWVTQSLSHPLGLMLYSGW